MLNGRENNQFGSDKHQSILVDVLAIRMKHSGSVLMASFRLLLSRCVDQMDHNHNHNSHDVEVRSVTFEIS